MIEIIKKYWEKTFAVLAVIIVVFSLQIATSANSNAHDAVTQAKSAATKAKSAADGVAQESIDRAHNVCDSSTQLRSLLDELDALLISPLNNDVKVIEAHRAIKEFTGTNPNCKDIPKDLP